MAKGGVWERGRKVLLLSSTFVFLRSPFRATVHHPLSNIHYAWNRLVHRGPESFFQCRCKGSIDVHLGAFDIFKSSYSSCNYSCFSISKTPLFFFYFPFCCRRKFLVICSWWWYFIVDRNELKCFLKRSLQCTFISVIVIHRNVHVYLYIITWKRKLARKKSVLISYYWLSPS